MYAVVYVLCGVLVRGFRVRAYVLVRWWVSLCGLCASIVTHHQSWVMLCRAMCGLCLTYVLEAREGQRPLRRQVRVGVVVAAKGLRRRRGGVRLWRVWCMCVLGDWGDQRAG